MERRGPEQRQKTFNFMNETTPEFNAGANGLWWAKFGDRRWYVVRLEYEKDAPVERFRGQVLSESPYHLLIHVSDFRVIEFGGKIPPPIIDRSSEVLDDMAIDNIVAQKLQQIRDLDYEIDTLNEQRKADSK